MKVENTRFGISSAWLILALGAALAACQAPGMQTRAESAEPAITTEFEPASDNFPLGTASDIDYARALWHAMQDEGLVGADAVQLEPFFGGAKPHGMILEIADQILSVNGHRGFVVVKRNYDGPGVSVKSVAADRARFLSSVTVMFQREAGYDDPNFNWFWVKYRPDGTLFRKQIMGRDMAMAGRIVKGPSWDESGGCIYCHSSAGGGDFIFYPEIEIPSDAG